MTDEQPSLTPDQLVVGYVSQALTRPADPPAPSEQDGMWYALLLEAIGQATPTAVQLLVDIAEGIDRGEDEQALCNFGAGLVETFLCHLGPGFARPVLNELTLAARTSESFRRALRCVWWTQDLHPDVVAWLRRFCPPPS